MVVFHVSAFILLLQHGGWIEIELGKANMTTFMSHPARGGQTKAATLAHSVLLYTERADPKAAERFFVPPLSFTFIKRRYRTWSSTPSGTANTRCRAWSSTPSGTANTRCRARSSTPSGTANTRCRAWSSTPSGTANTRCRARSRLLPDRGMLPSLKQHIVRHRETGLLRPSSSAGSAEAETRHFPP